MYLLSSGNSKMGKIYNFNLPAMITCPGASERCLEHCYALKGRYVFKNIIEKYKQNFHISLLNNFDELMSSELKLISLKDNNENMYVRIHSSGDFYSVEYIRKWINIAKKCPDINFYAYTRSWRVDKLRQELDIFRNLDNVYLFASTDDTTLDAEKKLSNGWLEASYLIEPYTSTKYKECYREDKCEKCKNCLEGKQSVRFMTSL